MDGNLDISILRRLLLLYVCMEVGGEGDISHLCTIGPIFS